MEWAFFAFLLMNVFSSDEQSLLSPAVKATFGLSEDVTPCIKNTPLEDQKQGVVSRGKASRFGLFGRRKCNKEIFAYGDRSSYYEFAVRSFELYLPKFVNGVSELKRRPRYRNLPVFCDLSGVKMPELAAHLKMACRSGLVSTLGGGEVLRVRDRQGRYLALRVEVAETASEAHLFETTVSLWNRDEKNADIWMEW